jgi:hypothetical protein
MAASGIVANGIGQRVCRRRNIPAPGRRSQWTGTLGSSPRHYSEPCNRCETFQAQIVSAGHPIMRT